MNYFRMTLFAGLVALFGFTTGAQANFIVNVQFGDTGVTPYTGAAMIGSSGNFWNYSQFSDAEGSPFPVSLKDQSGNATSVTFSNSGNGGAFTNPDSEFANGFWGGPYQDLMAGYLYSTRLSTNPNTIQIGGLNPSSKYNLYIYTQGDSGSDGRKLGVQIGTTTQITNATVASASSFILNQNYLLFSDVSPNGGGVISANWWQVIGEANINGIQIQEVQAVPEPGSMILTGLALAGMGGAAWRRRKGKATQNASESRDASQA